MKLFIYSLVLPMLCALPLSELQAQKKQTLYYPNGKVAFEGKFRMAWNQTERFQNPELLEQDQDFNRNTEFEEGERMLNAYKDIIPSKVYEGKCKYYYNNGKLFAEGTYTSGYKNGNFRFYYPDGKLAAKRTYEWGMASGHWESWDDKGQLSSSAHYKPIPDHTLQRINDKNILLKHSPDNEIKLFFGMDYENFFDSYKEQNLYAHSKNLRVFEKYVTKQLYHKAIKEGDFKVWENGKPFLEMSFHNNIPVGTWRIFRNDRPGFEIVFEDGKIIKATDFLNAENNFGSPEYLARKKELAGQYTVGSPDAIDPGAVGVPGVAHREEIFRTVQQMPEADYNFNQYISDNLKAPKGISAYKGKLIVEFVVRKDGRIDNVRSVRNNNADPALVAEVIKLVKKMPKWKPGKQNGQAVDVYYSLPVPINLQ